ncbi:hypothetical protein DVA80_21120, partial [Acinetobacter baumannii]
GFGNWLKGGGKKIFWCWKKKKKFGVGKGGEKNRDVFFFLGVFFFFGGLVFLCVFGVLCWLCFWVWWFVVFVFLFFWSFVRL